MGLPSNTVKASIYLLEGTSVSLRDTMKCEFGNTASPPLHEVTSTTDPESEDIGFNTSFNSLSLWSIRDILTGTTSARTKVMWHFEAHNKAGAYETIGCCQLQGQNGDPRLITRNYDRKYGPLGVLQFAGLTAALPPAT